MKKILSVAAAALLSVVALNAATDWPQWQGPDRTGISKETGLLKAVAGQRSACRLDGAESRQRLRIDGRRR